MLMKFLKEHYRRLFLVLILLFALICTCPFPRHIELEANGWQLDMSSEETMFEESAEISIEGWYLRHTLKDSNLRYEYCEDKKNERNFGFPRFFCLLSVILGIEDWVIIHKQKHLKTVIYNRLSHNIFPDIYEVGKFCFDWFDLDVNSIIVHLFDQSP